MPTHRPNRTTEMSFRSARARDCRDCETVETVEKSARGMSHATTRGVRDYTQTPHRALRVRVRLANPVVVSPSRRLTTGISLWYLLLLRGRCNSDASEIQLHRQRGFRRRRRRDGRRGDARESRKRRRADRGRLFLLLALLVVVHAVLFSLVFLLFRLDERRGRSAESAEDGRLRCLPRLLLGDGGETAGGGGRGRRARAQE